MLNRRPSTPDRFRMLLLAAAIALGLHGPAAVADTAPLQKGRIPTELRDTLVQHGVPPGAVSILVRRRGSSEPRLRVNAQTPRNPASVMKLFTTYAALEALGPGYTWETRVHVDGPVQNGRLQGDLWFEGAGDPFLTAEDFWDILGTLRRRGIEHIDGDLVFDTSRFAPAERDPGTFDNRPYRAYNQPPHPLLVNLNAIRFELEASQDPGDVRVSMHPPLGNLPVENRLRTDPNAWCGAYRWQVDYELGGNPALPQAVLKGNYGTGCGVRRLHRTGLPVETYVHGLFEALWDQWGGTFEGGWRTAAWPNARAEPLVRHESRSLAEIARLTNKFSNNVMARHLALTLAAERGRRPASESDGRDAVRETLAARHLDLDGFVLAEAAGLSRDNRLTAEHVAALLDTAAESLVMPEFLASLPVAGVDGTLRNRFRNTPEAGRVRMKTGSIDHVSAIAGYMRDAAGDDLIVVVLINHEGVHRGAGIAIQNAVLRWAFRSGA